MSNFKPVSFASAKKCCMSPLAVSVGRNDVSFRLASDLVNECKIGTDDLFALCHDSDAGLFALVADPKNETGEARKMRVVGGAKGGKLGRTLKVTFPRTDLLAQIWEDKAPITGLKLFDRRGPGKLVFHAPSKETKTGGVES